MAIIQRDEDGLLVGTVPSLKSCHTQAKDVPTLLKRLREVIALCLEVETAEPLEFVGLQEVDID